MSKRAAAVAQTRRRIIDATRALHVEQGIAATSWDDIAERAGVGVGTVYRHFPTPDELIPACGEIALQIVALPDPENVRAVFEGLDAPAERIGRLVHEAFAIYERGAPELRAMRNEPEVHPQVAGAREQVEATLDALVDTALSPSRIPRADRAVVRAMIDLGTWQALRDQGVEFAEAVGAVTQMIAGRVSPLATAGSGPTGRSRSPRASRTR